MSIIHHPRTAAATSAVAVVVTTFGAVPSSEGRQTPSEPGAGTSTTWPYAEPNPALGGRTLAQYVADHVQRRIHEY
jgi:hypothetical protein